MAAGRPRPHRGERARLKLGARDRLLLFGPAAALVGGGLVLPALAGFVASFTSYSPFATAVRYVALRNYAAVTRDPSFAAAARNVVAFALTAVPLELAIGFGLAWLLREPFRGRSPLRVLLLVPWLVSPIASGVMWHFLLGTTHGLLDFALGWLGRPDAASPIADPRLALATTVAVETWRVAPLVGFLLLPGLTAVPVERWEDARLSGAGSFRQALFVGLPAIRPLLLAVAMLLVGQAAATFDVVLILTGGGPGTATVTPALYSYDQAFGVNDWPAAAAAAWLVTLAVVVAGAAYVALARRDSEP